MSVRIEQLDYLAAVSQLGSLRRAAAELHISQPALSETLRNLERELGVTLLERKRSGAQVSEAGRDLLPHVTSVLEAVDRLRAAADAQYQGGRLVRVGTVNAATVPLLVPALRGFRDAHPATQVEVVAIQQATIQQQLLQGGIDLGLVNILSGDDPPSDLRSVPLLRGRPVVCVRSDSPLAALDRVGVEDLLTEPLILMRPGYVMHRYAYRLLGDRRRSSAYSTDGAEMGKLLVSEGLGITLLPDYSVVGDPLERAGVITARPIADDTTEVVLLLLSVPSPILPAAVRDMHDELVRHARAAD